MLKWFNNVIFMAELFTAEKMYKKILGYGLEDNSKSTNMDLFWKKMAVLAKGIL